MVNNMKSGIYSLNGKQLEEKELPRFFDVRVRPDLIKRAVLAVQSQRRQPYGKSQWGDKKWVVEPRGKGYDTSRVSRTRGGMGRSRVIPQAVGGRSVRAPFSQKKLIEKINKKEKRKALKSALTATADPNLVLLRGHNAEEVPEVPLIIENDFENIQKTDTALQVLEKLGLQSDLTRVKESTSVRAGKGKTRGRKYQKKKSILIVVSSKEKNVVKAARNIPGVDVVPYNHLSVENLAPGTHCGRITLFTERSIDLLKERFKTNE